MPPIATDCHRVPRIATDCHRLPLTATDCHRLPLTATECAAAWLHLFPGRAHARLLECGVRPRAPRAHGRLSALGEACSPMAPCWAVSGWGAVLGRVARGRRSRGSRAVRAADRLQLESRWLPAPGPRPAGMGATGDAAAARAGDGVPGGAADWSPRASCRRHWWNGQVEGWKR